MGFFHFFYEGDNLIVEEHMFEVFIEKYAQ